jgi:hypothetical protein
MSQAPVTDCGCCTEKHKEFNFWLGEWEVFNGDKLAGYNSIKIDQDSCVLVERWRSVAGNFTGTSYNFYNKSIQRWQQLWIDNQGGQLQLMGGFTKGEMIMYTEEMVNQDNEKYINRITWTPHDDGTVRQHWETSTDHGASWNTAFDGLYKRKGP